MTAFLDQQMDFYRDLCCTQISLLLREMPVEALKDHFQDKGAHCKTKDCEWQVPDNVVQMCMNEGRTFENDICGEGAKESQPGCSDQGNPFSSLLDPSFLQKEEQEEDTAEQQ